MTPRVLMCITVYNGRAFVPRALHSAKHVSAEGLDLDILVLDDCSPEPDWSSELAVICSELGIDYYRSPRNLGIPRNFNLALATGVDGGYDYVILCNSDVVFPVNLARQLVRACQDETLGSVTAFSNNVSVFSLPNRDPNRFLVDQSVVDWVSGCVEGEFGGNVLDIPSGVGFCMIFPTKVIQSVGLMDPVFGRGYCEEIDWTLRSKAAGYRVGLAPGVFVYHEGGATNRLAGLLVGQSTTVQAHEEIIDLRYPQYRYQLTAFESSGLLKRVHDNALERILGGTGKEIGYTIDVGWLRYTGADPTQVHCLIAPRSRSEILIEYRGFEHTLPIVYGDDALALLVHFFGRKPDVVNYDSRAKGALAWDGIPYPVEKRLSYPTAL